MMLLSLAFLFVQTFSSPQNLIVNGNMETGSSSPAVWQRGGNLNSANLIWCSDESVSGTYSLKIVDHSTNAYGAWYQRVELPAGIDEHSLNVSWYWKYENIGDGQSFHFVVTYFNAGNTVIGSYDFPCTGSSEWTFRQVVWPVLNDAAYVHFILKSAGDQSETGTIWIDDVSAYLTNMPVGLARVDAMPDMPEPYVMRDWKKVARDYDALTFDFSKTGDYLPLIWTDTTRRNFDFDSFGQPSYVGHHSMSAGAAHEAVNCIAAVLGASLCGIDKSNQNGTNRVAMLEQYYNLSNGQHLVLNRVNTVTGNTFWYEILPSLLFCQLLDLYPGADRMENEMRTIASRITEASRMMGGTVSPWTVPDYEHTAFNFLTGEAVDNGRWCEPDVAAAYGWISYMAWTKWGDTNHLNTARWGMEFLHNRSGGAENNPFYESLLPYGAYLSARMNAELGTEYDTEKLLSWVFGPSEGYRNGFGVICDEPWNGRDCSGLIGSVANGGGYAFAMNTFNAVGAILPLVRYDDSFAKPVAKWILNAANAARLFYSAYLPESNQTSYAWSSMYDTNSCIAYEGLRKYWNNESPVGIGDAMRKGSAATDLGLYGSSHVGFMAACIETSNVPGILKLDCLATDFYRAPAYPTFLYFNPYSEPKAVEINTGGGAVDLYDCVTNQFIEYNVSGAGSFSIPAKSAMLLVLVPANADVEQRNGKMYANDIVIDFNIP